MCDTCGCSITDGNRAHAHAIHAPSGADTVEVLESLLAHNDHQARHNREHFNSHGVLALNLMSSPGAGKTTLLESTIDALGGKRRIAVIEGDLETENDAARIRRRGVQAVQITTGTACHLDAHLVHEAVHELDLDELDIVFIENVGNLVCPASFDLGQHLNVILLSTTEGDDKPAKYPVMFRDADLVLVTKTDLLAALKDDFQPEKAESAIRALGNEAPILRLSPRQAHTLEPWLDWILQSQARQRPAPLSQAL